MPKYDYYSFVRDLFPESPVRGVLWISSDSDVRRIVFCFGIFDAMVRKILASIFLGSLIQAGIFLDIQYAFWKLLCLGNLIRHGIFGGFVGSPRDFLGC